jgi:hypothetical protein
MTVPDPEPDFVMVNLYAVDVDMLKAAVTDFAAVIVTAQVPVPEHPPDQPEKVEPLVAKAANATDFPDS